MSLSAAGHAKGVLFERFFCGLSRHNQNLASYNRAMNAKPITYTVLKDLADSGLIIDIQAYQLPNGSGYRLIARTRTGERILHKTRNSTLPRLFRSLDSVADNCKMLGFKRFEVVNIKIHQ